MTTELVWSTLKPTFEEVKGKKIKFIWDYLVDQVTIDEATIYDERKYTQVFDENFICYADLTAPVSPLPLWGKLPEFRNGANDGFFLQYDTGDPDKWELESPLCETRDLAILAWNRIAEALNEVEK